MDHQGKIRYQLTQEQGFSFQFLGFETLAKQILAKKFQIN
jgi:hypothetical protein